MTDTEPMHILNDTEREIINLLQFVEHDADDFANPELGDFFDRLESVILDGQEIDATLVEIIIGHHNEHVTSTLRVYTNTFVPRVSFTKGTSKEKRLQDILNQATITSSSGVKAEVLQAMCLVQQEHFSCVSPSSGTSIQRLTELMQENHVIEGSISRYVVNIVLEPLRKDLHLGGDDPEWLHLVNSIHAIRTLLIP